MYSKNFKKSLTSIISTVVLCATSLWGADLPPRDAVEVLRDNLKADRKATIAEVLVDGAGIDSGNGSFHSTDAHGATSGRRYSLKALVAKALLALSGSAECCCSRAAPRPSRPITSREPISPVTKLSP